MNKLVYEGRLLARRIIGYQNISRMRKAKNTWQLNGFLSHFDSPQNFWNYASTIRIGDHLVGGVIHPLEKRRAIINTLFDALLLDLHGRSFIDLGPGIGDSLDVAFERGASKVAFVDYDPYFLAFNILKGFRAYHVDYLVEGLDSVLESYDVVLSRGSINADRFNRHEVGVLSFETWLTGVERITRKGGITIICPTFDKGKKEDAYPFIPHNLETFPTSIVGKTLKQHGFVNKFIQGFNEPPEMFPFTFIKYKENQS